MGRAQATVMRVRMKARVAEDDSRTLEALRVIARLLLREKNRLDIGAELRLHDDGGPR